MSFTAWVTLAMIAVGVAVYIYMNTRETYVGLNGLMKPNPKKVKKERAVLVTDLILDNENGTLEPYEKVSVSGYLYDQTDGWFVLSADANDLANTVCVWSDKKPLDVGHVCGEYFTCYAEVVGCGELMGVELKLLSF